MHWHVDIDRQNCQYIDIDRLNCQGIDIDKLICQCIDKLTLTDLHVNASAY